jgi:hypothetical protein
MVLRVSRFETFAWGVLAGIVVATVSIATIRVPQVFLP